jgi:hypothetical protein
LTDVLGYKTAEHGEMIKISGAGFFIENDANS